MLITETQSFLLRVHALLPSPISGNNSRWNNFVHRQMNTWCLRILQYTARVPKGLQSLVVRYEDIRQDAVREVSHMLDYLQFQYTHETLVERMRRDYQQFHRKESSVDYSESFTPSQRVYVEGKVREMLRTLSEKKHRVTFRIEEYLTEMTSQVP